MSKSEFVFENNENNSLDLKTDLAGLPPPHNSSLRQQVTFWITKSKIYPIENVPSDLPHHSGVQQQLDFKIETSIKFRRFFVVENVGF